MSIRRWLNRSGDRPSRFSRLLGLNMAQLGRPLITQGPILTNDTDSGVSVANVHHFALSSMCATLCGVVFKSLRQSLY